MPGPGGGARGGGGGRGFSGGGRGFSGGGRSGGGFSGGHHHHHGHFGFSFWPRRRYYGYGGGCLGGLISAMIAPIIMIIIAAVFLFVSVTSAFTAIANGGVIQYNEEKLQDYADRQYAEIYGASTAYEDNILIVFVTDEEYYNYAYIAWVGDHISQSINYMFGASGTVLGRAMDANINQTNYKYSLDSNLAFVVNTMRDRVAAQSNMFDCTETHNQVDPKFVNNTDLPMTAATVSEALVAFETATGITMSIVVDDAEDVFGKTMPVGYIITAIIAIAVIAAVIYYIYKNRKGGGGASGNTSGDDAGNGYTGSRRKDSSFDTGTFG
ncbi:MAG: hypothetical protein J6V09_01270 [Clostridia bacterium]|nr:hypothetical protein [Clostridia bacterium]